MYQNKLCQDAAQGHPPGAAPLLDGWQGAGRRLVGTGVCRSPGDGGTRRQPVVDRGNRPVVGQGGRRPDRAQY